MTPNPLLETKSYTRNSRHFLHNHLFQKTVDNARPLPTNSSCPIEAADLQKTDLSQILHDPLNVPCTSNNWMRQLAPE
jgi:hypothetical protein